MSDGTLPRKAATGLKILIVKLSSLGDVVHAMPAVQDIRRALPDAHIDWVVETAFADLVRRCEGVSRVLPLELRRWRRAPWAAETRQAVTAFRALLREEAYDRVIDLQGLTKSALVAWAARLAPGGHRVALGNRTSGSSFEAPTRWVAHQAVYIPPRIHAVDRGRVLCAHALDYAPDGPQLFGLRAVASANSDTNSGAKSSAISSAISSAMPSAIPSVGGGDTEAAATGFVDAAPNAARPEVALVHGTSRDDKLWPEAHWVALGQALQARGLALGLPHGSDAELARAERIAGALGAGAQVWPRLALGELADRLAGCAGVVGVDSGLSHIATALDLPHVQIYNHDTAWRTGPVGRARQRSVFAQPHPDLEAVLAAWDEVSAA